jgi:hypothetical protein
LEFKFTALLPRGQINPIYHYGLISAIPRGWRFLGGGPVVWLLLWPLHERGPVRRCEINSLPRADRSPYLPQGSREFVTTSQINSQHWPKVCPGAHLSFFEHYFTHISS